MVKYVSFTQSLLYASLRKKIKKDDTYCETEGVILIRDMSKKKNTFNNLYNDLYLRIRLF